MDPAETADFRADEPGVHPAEGPSNETKDPSDVSIHIAETLAGLLHLTLDVVKVSLSAVGKNSPNAFWVVLRRRSSANFEVLFY